MGHTAAIPTVSQVEPAMGHTAAIPTVSQVEPAMGHTAAIPTVSLQRCCWGLESPSKLIIFTGETVTLSCEVEGGSDGWRFKQYRGRREEAGCSDQYSRRYGDSCTISKARHAHSGVYWCESASGQERSNAVNLTVSKLPKTTLTLEHPFPEIFTRETVTLRCGVEGGSAGWKYLWYKDSEDTPVLQTAGRSITGDSYTITAAAVSDQGQYCCRGQRGDQPLNSQLGDEETVTASGEFINTVILLH
ncbi:UNVERIFIED_CONTAM: hypothetical protein FKN15_047674 [Acipenser sinensis]